MNLKHILKKFLSEKADLKQPFLLGLSGGSDSMALFHLLLDLKKEGNLNFGVAHINHNWRKESLKERDQLKKMALNADIPFHLLELNPNNLKGNLELACRLERLKFFKEICESYSYQAVILGHHLDDLAETVLKRLFEGATIPKLYGLKNKTEIEGLIILRPLMECKKSVIEKFLQEKQIIFFEDSTNQDPKFMRARFRTKIIPYLNAEFGKDIREPLYRLGAESLEIHEYFKQKFRLCLDKIVRGEAGCYLDFKGFDNKLEIKYLIRMFTEGEGFFLSYSMVETACDLIETNKTHKSMSIGGQNIFFNKKKMFVLSDLSTQGIRGLSPREKTAFLRLSFNLEN